MRRHGHPTRAVSILPQARGNLEPTMKWTGGCLCGAVRYRAVGEPVGACHCHCDTCRRHSGAAFASAIGFADEDVIWTNGEPSRYHSSPSCARLFCANCGSSSAQYWVDIGMLWPYVGTLDNPASVKPEFHMFTEEQLPWVKLDDGLPCHSKFPPTRKGKEGDEAFPD